MVASTVTDQSLYSTAADMLHPEPDGWGDRVPTTPWLIAAAAAMALGAERDYRAALIDEAIRRALDVNGRDWLKLRVIAAECAYSREPHQWAHELAPRIRAEFAKLVRA